MGCAWRSRASYWPADPALRCGPGPYAWSAMAGTCTFDFGRIEAWVLSHGHFDRFGGAGQSPRADSRSEWRSTGSAACASRSFRQTGPAAAQWRSPSVRGCAAAARAESRGAGVASAEAEQQDSDGLFYLSGEIPRRSFEHCWKTTSSARGWGTGNRIRGSWTSRSRPPTCREKGSQSLQAAPRPRGVNICRHAQEVFPDVPL